MRIQYHLKKVLGNRYFIVFTLLLLWLGTQIGYYGIDIWPEGSLQLSSEATTGASSNEASPCASCEKQNHNSPFSFIHTYQNAVSTDEKKITSMDEVVKIYENSKNVKALMKILNSRQNFTCKRRDGRRIHVSIQNGHSSNPHKMCYCGVKKILLKSGITDGDYLGGRRAKVAGLYLKKHGFINLLDTDYKDKIKSPYDCPRGGIIVYSGGPGHIEICTGSGFMSDYYSKSPRTGNRLSANHRTVVGVYIKSNDEINNYLASNDNKNDSKKEGQVR